MFGFIKKIFIGLLASVVSACSHTKWVSLSNQNCMTQLTIINLHPNEYTQRLPYYPFVVNLDRCVGNCNTSNDLSNKVCSKQNRRFKSNSIEHDYMNKWIENINKPYIIRM